MGMKSEREIRKRLEYIEEMMSEFDDENQYLKGQQNILRWVLGDQGSESSSSSFRSTSQRW